MEQTAPTQPRQDKLWRAIGVAYGISHTPRAESVFFFSWRPTSTCPRRADEIAKSEVQKRTPSYCHTPSVRIVPPRGSVFPRVPRIHGGKWETEDGVSSDGAERRLENWPIEELRLNRTKRPFSGRLVTVVTPIVWQGMVLRVTVC